MPNIKSAIKRVKTSEKSRVRNAARKSTFRTLSKRVETLIAAGKTETLPQAASAAVSAIDRAAKTNAIHSGQADRRKSRLIKKVNAALGQGVVLEPRIEKKAAKPAPKKTAAKSTAKPVAKKAPAKKAPKTE